MNGRSGEKFIAIDFETADHGHDSACSVALVSVESGQIVQREHYYIRPSRNNFIFTNVHGIVWEDVVDKPTFGELWPTLRESLKNKEFFVAHNAAFDQSVLYSCCRVSGFRPPELPFKCTMEIARNVWNIYPTKLPDVCKRLKIRLDHHNALSDAEACALIYIASQKRK